MAKVELRGLGAAALGRTPPLQICVAGPGGTRARSAVDGGMLEAPDVLTSIDDAHVDGFISPSALTARSTAAARACSNPMVSTRTRTSLRCARNAGRNRSIAARMSIRANS